MTAKKAKPQEPAKKVDKSRSLSLPVRPGEDEEQSLARLAMASTPRNASTALDASKNLFPDLNLQHCITTLRDNIKAVNNGDLSKVEGMLVGQALALDAIFNKYAKLAMHAEYMAQLEPYMKIALKAQAQSRTTAEAISELKNPTGPTFVKQQNIANQQQINNGVPTPQAPAPARTEEKDITPTNELLEVSHGERLDIGATSTTGASNPDMATVGKVDRTKDRGRKGDGVAQLL